MFRWILVALAAAGLMAGIEFGRILLGVHGRESITPHAGHWLGLLLSIAFTLGTMLVIGFLDYKAEKKKGNVVRRIPLYEQALAMAEEQREHPASGPEPEPPKEG